MQVTTVYGIFKFQTSVLLRITKVHSCYLDFGFISATISECPVISILEPDCLELILFTLLIVFCCFVIGLLACSRGELKETKDKAEIIPPAIPYPVSQSTSQGKQT